MKMGVQRREDGYWAYFTGGYAYGKCSPRTLYSILIYGYPDTSSSYKVDNFVNKNRIPSIDECLAYKNEKDELIIRDIEWFKQLLIYTLPELITVEEFAADNKKSSESIKKYLQQDRVRGAQLLKSPSAKKGIWVIPKNADISESPYKKVTKRGKYVTAKYKTTNKKENIIKKHKIPIEINKGYITIYDYAVLHKRTVQQVLNQIQSNKIEAQHISFKTGGKRGVWIVKEGCDWPVDGRRKV